MRICENGIFRDATEQEIADLQQIADLAAALPENALEYIQSHSDEVLATLTWLVGKISRLKKLLGE